MIPKLLSSLLLTSKPTPTQNGSQALPNAARKLIT
ncbi:uncharacterized protein METZ01_LOCUS98725, partial [marine metagenome]